MKKRSSALDNEFPSLLLDPLKTLTAMVWFGVGWPHTKYSLFYLEKEFNAKAIRTNTLYTNKTADRLQRPYHVWKSETRILTNFLSIWFVNICLTITNRTRASIEYTRLRHCESYRVRWHLLKLVDDKLLHSVSFFARAQFDFVVCEKQNSKICAPYTHSDVPTRQSSVDSSDLVLSER